MACAAASGGEFRFLAQTQSRRALGCRPVVAVVAVRTGCGKSQTSHYVIERLKERGLTCVLCRHPMPYGARARAGGC